MEPNQAAQSEVSASERRQHARRKVLKRGQIIYQDGYCVMDCVVLDVSDTGARIAPEDRVYCPDSFSLQFHNGPMCWCQVVYRRATCIGVKFMDRAGPKILLVDDGSHFSLLRLHAYELSYHFEVHTVSTPGHALELIDQGRSFAVVVATMDMKGMNGIDLAREVRKRLPSTAPILLSEHRESDAEKRAYGHGEVFRFLTMPCGLDKMLPAVRDGISEFRRRRLSRPGIA